MDRYRVSFKEKLNPNLAPHVDEAYNHYKKEYYDSHRKERIYYIRSLKYFHALREIFEGASVKMLAASMGVTVVTMQSQCIKAQFKVESYLSLKELGRL